MDPDRKLLHELEMVDTTDKAHGEIYNGWWYLGRPTPEEIRMDLRELMSRRPDWVYGDGV
jgi:hypothetical protein